MVAMWCMWVASEAIRFVMPPPLPMSPERAVGDNFSAFLKICDDDDGRSYKGVTRVLQGCWYRLWRW
jgi:hypothetical protein